MPRRFDEYTREELNALHRREREAWCAFRDWPGNARTADAWYLVMGARATASVSVWTMVEFLPKVKRSLDTWVLVQRPDALLYDRALRWFAALTELAHAVDDAP